MKDQAIKLTFYHKNLQLPGSWGRFHIEVKPFSTPNTYFPDLVNFPKVACSPPTTDLPITTQQLPRAVYRGARHLAVFIVFGLGFVLLVSYVLTLFPHLTVGIPGNIMSVFAAVPVFRR